MDCGLLTTKIRLLSPAGAGALAELGKIPKLGRVEKKYKFPQFLKNVEIVIRLRPNPRMKTYFA